MIRPSPEDVLTALDEIKPGARKAALRRCNRKDHVKVRRTAMAVARAFGHSLPRIGRAFQRDHSTVLSALRRYTYAQHFNPASATEEADLFRRLLRAALAVAERRSAGGNVIWLRGAA